MQPPPPFFFLTFIRPLGIVFAGLVSTLGCASTRATPDLPGAPPAAAAGTPRAATRWSLERTPGVSHYVIRSSATVALDGDTVPADSLATTMVVAVSVADSGTVLAVTGAIDSLRFERGARVIAADTTHALPIILHATLDRQGGVLSLAGLATSVDSACAATLDPLIAMTRDLFVRLPGRMTAGTAWQDTTETTSCRGRIPITTTTIASYTVRGEQDSGGRTGLAIDRTTTLTLSGSGIQFGRSATIHGSGAGAGTLLFDPATAALIQGESAATLTVTFEAGMLRQTFTQQGRQDIQRR